MGTKNQSDGEERMMHSCLQGFALGAILMVIGSVCFEALFGALGAGAYAVYATAALGTVLPMVTGPMMAFNGRGRRNLPSLWWTFGTGYGTFVMTGMEICFHLLHR